MFLSPPSKEAPGTRRGYRSTTRVLDRGLQERLDTLTRDAYAQAVEKLVARVEALRPTPIKEQLAEAAKGAEQHNASHKAPSREKEGHDDR